MPRTSRRDTNPEPFWRDLMDRWRASGQTVAAFCAAHRVGQATFYSCRKRLAAAGPDTTTPAPTFAPVRVVPEPTAEVILPTGLVLRVPVSADPAAIVRRSARLQAGLGTLLCDRGARIA
jgi:hypothetical protein